MYRIDEGDYEELLDALRDSGQCPYGKQIMGCPVDLSGEVLGCAECWAEFFEDYGLTEER